ncbi:MAG: exodeoxyribonuclease VII large subunit [Prevotella sp.]|jgi:exodeoxyribonuclease VII large subunit|nr:exodeoxyribonuclease VII large subunit [Prevotella sp.]MCI2080979.1 exodeoxyribonuclease VII large subunit [Prevotella sp.]MCI2102850.1 exodeoxyribonuclease VII large subunit [Prevotella sp.]
MRNAFTLYELNQMVRQVLETDMPDEYWVEAELSEIREVRGHCYMELIQKDEYNNTPIARASAKCWSRQWMVIQPYFERITGQRLHAGLKVLLKVVVNFHEAYGFSWIVVDIDPTYTMGDMARRRQEIIQKLKAEGVFDMQKELEIPMFAQRIAVISSANAAGYGDFRHQLSDNDHGFQFSTQLFPAIMQGEQVEESVIAALNQVNRQIDHFDVVVIIRGGGATSDLSGFDTFDLAENVANFPLPILTGIGHERDESVLDLVANTSLKTPTAVAAFLIDHLETVNSRIEEALQSIAEMVKRKMDTEKLRLGRLAEKIPLLFSVVKAKRTSEVDALLAKLIHQAESRVSDEQHRIYQLQGRLKPAVERRLTEQMHRVTLLGQKVFDMDPRRLLEKGYSITLFEGKAVRDAAALKKGDEIVTKLNKGSVKSIIS